MSTDLMGCATELIGAGPAAAAYCCGADDPAVGRRQRRPRPVDVGLRAIFAGRSRVAARGVATLVSLRFIHRGPNVHVVGELGQVFPAQHQHAGVVTAPSGPT